MKEMWKQSWVLIVVPGIVLGAAGCRKADETADTTPAAPEPVAVAPQPLMDPGASGDGAEVIVSVDGAELSRAELNQMVGQFMSQQNVQGLPPEMMQNLIPRIEQRVVDGFVARQVLLQEAKRQEIEVDSAAVDETIDDLAQRLPAGMTMESALAGMGMSEAELRDQIGNDLQAQKLIEAQVEATPSPTEEDIQSFYEQQKGMFEMPETVHARHILVKVDEDADEASKQAKREKAEKLHKQLVEGADFAELAGKASDCPSGESGGDLGTFQRGQMVPPFEEAAFTQEVGVIGPVIETPFGYHIVEVLERNEAETQELADVRDNVAELLLNRKKQEAAQAYVEALKDQADIQYSQPRADEATELEAAPAEAMEQAADMDTGAAEMRDEATAEPEAGTTEVAKPDEATAEEAQP